MRNETRLTAAGDKTYRQIRQQNVGVFLPTHCGDTNKTVDSVSKSAKQQKRAMEEGYWGRGYGAGLQSEQQITHLNKLIAC